MEIINVMMRSCANFQELQALYINYNAPKMRANWAHLAIDCEFLKRREHSHVRSTYIVTDLGTWLDTYDHEDENGVLDPEKDSVAVMNAAEWWNNTAHHGNVVCIAVITAQRNGSYEVGFYDIV